MKKLVLLVLASVVFTACGAAKDPIADKEKPVAILNCSVDAIEYQVEGTSMKFCYDKQWGEPVVEDVKAKAGTAMEISFSKFSKDNPVVVWIQSRDFLPETGESVKFEFLNAMQSDEEKLKEQLKNAVGYESAGLMARKSDVGGVRAIRVENQGRLEYFVPDAFYDHHVMVSGPLTAADDIDSFVFDMVF